MLTLFNNQYVFKVRAFTFNSSAQFSKDIGIAPLKTLMGILQDLVTRLQGFQETTYSEESAETSQEESELFLEINQSSMGEANKEQVVEKLHFSFKIF